jgi:Leucine-rich repeat (LRR) protein
MYDKGINIIICHLCYSIMRAIRWLWVAAFLPAMSVQHLQGCELPTHCKTGLQGCKVTQLDYSYSYRHFPYLSVNSIDPFINPRDLTILKFDKCGITSLAYTVFHDMNNLKLLTLSGNSLATLDSRVFYSQWELDHLDLSHNKLISIDNLFTSQGRLRTLLLDHNKLTSFKLFAFLHLTSLIHLDLSYSNLNRLSNDLFSSQEHLEKLLLDGNRLTAVSVKLLTPLTSIKQFGLSHNPLVCNCELQLTVLWCEEGFGYRSHLSISIIAWHSSLE